MRQIQSVRESAMGKPYPDFYGGFNNSFTFKKLTLDFLFIFSVGQKYMMITEKDN